MHRISCPFSCYASDKEWLKSKSKYVLKDQTELLRLGSFSESLSLWQRAFSVFGKSSLVQLLGLRTFDSIAISEYDLFASMLDKVANQFSKSKSIQEKIFILAYGSNNDRTYLTPKLKARGFKVLDYSTLDRDKILGDKAWIPYDMHPSGAANRWMAGLINKDLFKSK